MHAKIAGKNVLMHTGGFDVDSLQTSHSPHKNIRVIVMRNEGCLLANKLNGSVFEIAYAMLMGKDVKKIIASHAKIIRVLFKNLKAKLQKKNY